MPDPMIDTTVVENLILGALIALNSSSFRVLAPHEAPPAVDADKVGDTPPARWCRLNDIILTPLDESGRAGAGDAAVGIATVTITVGCSLAAMDPAQTGDPARLNKDVFEVAAAIDGVFLDHAASTHRVRFKKATRRTEPIGFHELMRTGIVTANATVYRKTGRTAVLTTS